MKNEVNVIVNSEHVIEYFKELIQEMVIDCEDDEMCSINADMLNGAITFAESFGIITDEQGDMLKNM